jgi:hypothetical protein
MSDFIFQNKDRRSSEAKTVSFAKPTRKEFGLFFKVVLFIAAFSGLIYTSMISNNLFLTEILVSGGILSLVLFIHILSNR